MRWIIVVLFSALSGSAARAESPKVIDVHLHAFPADTFGEPAPPNPWTGTPTPFRSDAELREATLATLARAGIVRAVASGPLSEVAKWREADPARIIPAVYLGEYWELHPSQALRPLFQSRELQILGELGLQFIGLSPAADELRAYFRLAEELDVPVAIHTGVGPPGTPYAPCCGKFRIGLGNPALIEEVLLRHPGLRVYIMHAGWPNLRDTIALLYVYPQVYADLSAINWLLPRAEFHGYLEALVRAGFVERLMFGSDQMIWPEAIPAAIEAIESATFLTAEQRQAIFYGNAARFLRLSTLESHAAQQADDPG